MGKSGDQSVRYGQMWEEPPLEEAIELLVDDFHQGTGILVNTHINVRTMYPQLVKTLYRIIQEALTNISKHAHATTVHQYDLRQCALGDQR